MRNREAELVEMKKQAEKLMTKFNNDEARLKSMLTNMSMLMLNMMVISRKLTFLSREKSR